MRQAIQTGDTVKVLAKGIFNSQEVKVLNIKRTSKGKAWYLLDVTYQDKKRPSWFETNEIELIAQQESKS